MSSPIMRPKPSRRGIATAAAVLLLSLAITPQLAPAASAAGVFASLVGTWSGKGVMHLEDGQQETIACEANYKEKDKGKKRGTKLTMTLKCDSNRFKVNLRSRLSHKAGALSGGWMEIDREVSGSGKGQIDDQSISLYLNAVGFSADLQVARGDCAQAIELTPESGEVKRVTVEMKKGGC